MDFPNFFIVGAPKSGTTSLYYYLKEHPEIYMSSEKEPNFFSYDEIEQQKLYYRKKNIKSTKKYQKLFSQVNQEKAIGEASVSYLFYPEIPQKIKSTFPEAKIIIILRDPVKRAFSHYLMDFRLRYTQQSFEDIIFDKQNYPLFYQQYLELGLYYDQVERYLNIFKSDCVKILIFNDFIKETKNVVSSLYRFLNVDSGFFPELAGKYNQSLSPKIGFIRLFYGLTGLRRFLKYVLPNSILSKVAVHFSNSGLPSLKEDSKKFLRSFYAEDIRKLENLLKIDLKCWLR